MATLTNTKIKDTYKSLLKVSDNGNLEAGLQEITDGEGNASGVQLNTAGDLTASGTLAFGELKDSGENITISKFVDEADGIASNDNDTSIPTSAAVKDYVDTKVTAEDLDFAGDSGTGAVDLDSQTFTIAGTANEVVTSASGQTVTIGLPSSITVDVQGSLTGNVTGNVSGNVTGNVSGNVTGDLTGTVTGTSVLADGVTATTQLSSDNSTKVATTAFVKSVVTAEDLDFGGDSGTGSVDLDSQSLSIVGTANEIVTSASGQTLTVGLPSSITVDVTGNLTGNVSGNVTGDVTGNASTATKLQTSRTIALSGDVVGSGSFDGSANLTLSTTIQANSVALGTDTTGDYVANLGSGTGVTIANNTGEGSNPTIAVNYGSTANTAVEGDTLVTIQGTASEIEVSGGAVTLGAGGTVTVGLPNDVVIAGNLTVNGTTTTVNTQTLSVKDPLIELANDNAANSVDTGFYANYSTDAGVTTKYAGLFRDAGDSDKFKLFKGLEVEPATTVDTSGTGYAKADLVVADLDATSSSISGNLAVDTDTLFVDSSNDRVGINKNNPSVALDVTGAAAISSTLAVTGTTSLTDDLAVDTDTLFVDASADRVGINKNNPAVALDVVGDITSSATITGTTLAGTLSTAAQPNVTSVGTLSSLAVSGNLTVDTDTLYVDAASNEVGIGTLTPDGTLHVHTGSAGTVTAEAAADNLVVENSGDGGISILTPDANFGKLTFGSPTKNEGAIVRYNQASTTMTIGTEIASGLLQFRTGGGIEAMRIDASGNVGIGTSSIGANSALLVSKNNGYLSVNSNVGAGGASNPSYDNGLHFGFNRSNGDGEANIVWGKPSGLSGYLQFASWDGSTFTERMRIDASGATSLKNGPNNGYIFTVTNDASSSSYGSTNGKRLAFFRSDSTSIPDQPGIDIGYSTTGEGIIAGSTNATGSPIAFYIFDGFQWAERARMTTTGLSFPNGNGIDFSASAGGGASSSLLDDYEEGTWTPAIEFGGASVGITYAAASANYTKIGRQVTVVGVIELSNKGSSSGAAKILGLPFTVANNANQESGVSFGLIQNLSFADIPVCRVGRNSTTIELREVTTAGVLTTINDTEFTNTSTIQFSATYFV